MLQASHANKGAQDAEGGQAKSVAKKASCQLVNPVSVQTTEEMFELYYKKKTAQRTWLAISLQGRRRAAGVRREFFQHIKKGEIDREEEASRWDGTFETVKGTRSFHSVRAAGKNGMYSRIVSCAANRAWREIKYDSCANLKWNF
eukprot:scaffold44662_cov43-Prasinocladus_malaysianus.AAC.1